jgi:hypothetical protein
MKNYRNWNFVLIIIFLLGFICGCENEGALTPIDTDVSESELTISPTQLSKPGNNYYPGSYPQLGSTTVDYWQKKNIYRGGGIAIPNGSNFSLASGSLIPPPGTPFGDPVTITMQVERDFEMNELLFTFGPSGCLFNEPAEVEFDWSDLGIEVATLYYIDGNGNYVPQAPASISINNKKMMIYIDHFSRYAIGDEQ